jgi:hypothetical protein
LNIAVAQTVKNLDDNNGFKQFKFGDSKQKWLPHLLKSSINFQETYECTDICCTTAFGYTVSQKLLSFDKNEKLTRIVLHLKERQQADGQRAFYNNIVSAFGPPTGKEISTDNSGNINFQWSGRKVTLTMYNFYKGAFEGGWEITLFFDLNENMEQPNKDY